jgi:hypothetical protein
MAATLGCNPVYRDDWSTLGTIDVFDPGIIPGAVLDVQLIEINCSVGDETSYSDPLTVVMSAVGDVVGSDCVPPPCSPPQGVVDFVDVMAVLNKFMGVDPSRPRKAIADVVSSHSGDPNPDQRIGFADIGWTVDAFRGTPSLPIGPPTTDPCAE